MAATYSSSSKANKRKVIESPENFLEALRGLGKSATSEITNQAKKAIFSDVPESFGLTTSGTIKPNESLNLDQLQQAEDRGYRQAEADLSPRLQHLHEQEYQRLIQAESASKQQIQTILVEIRDLAKSMGNLAQEIQVAAIQAPINPGIYHKNFFAHLRSVIAALKQKVDSSSSWLAAANNRAGKKGHYWTQVSKSGTKFMLSSERYMVTSTG